MPVPGHALAALLAELQTPFGPVETPFDPEPGPFIALFGFGFLVAAFGHIIESKTTIAAGIFMCFSAVLLLPLGLYLSE